MKVLAVVLKVTATTGVEVLILALAPYGLGVRDVSKPNILQNRNQLLENMFYYMEC